MIRARGAQARRFPFARRSQFCARRKSFRGLGLFFCNWKKSLRPQLASWVAAKAHQRRSELLLEPGILSPAGGGPKERARAAIPSINLLQEIRNRAKLPHEQSIPSACRIVGPPFRRVFRGDKSARKKFLRKIACNPLISLDSDERIQGNPSFSNPQNQGFS